MNKNNNDNNNLKPNPLLKVQNKKILIGLEFPQHITAFQRRKELQSHSFLLSEEAMYDYLIYLSFHLHSFFLEKESNLEIYLFKSLSSKKQVLDGNR